MKNWKIATVVLVFAVLLALPLVASARQGKGGMGGGMGMGGSMGGDLPIDMVLHNQEIADEIGLTSEQQEKLRKLFLDSKKEDIRTKADLQILKLELGDLLEQDNPNVKQVDKKIDEMTKLQSKMMKSKIHALLEGKKILTDEQIEKIKTLLRERMSERRGKQGGRGMKNERGRGGQGRGDGGGFGGSGGPPPDDEIPPEFNSPFPSPDDVE